MAGRSRNRCGRRAMPVVFTIDSAYTDNLWLVTTPARALGRLMPVLCALVFSVTIAAGLHANASQLRSNASMVEWNLNTPDIPAPPRTPDGLTSGQLGRLVASSPRPFVLISEREISVLRRGLTKDGWKRSLYLQPADLGDGRYSGVGTLSIANQWLDQEINIPVRSGHYHHFFCDCGSRLTMPNPLEIQEEYICPVCERKFSGEKYDGAVRYMQHNRLARAALALALVYAIEKDKAYSDKAAEILVKYAQAYPGPHTDAITGGMLYQSLCESVWVIPLAQAYDLIYYSRSLDDEQKRLVEDRLLRPVAQGLKACGIGGNWGSWHLSAVGVVGLAIKDVGLVQYALESFKSQIAEQLGDDGLWPESVHTYHFYPLSAFVYFAEACIRAGIDIYNWEPRPGKSLKAMFTAPLQYMYPSFRLPAINDGWYDSFLPLDLYEIAHRRWDDPTFAWVLKRGYKFGESPINQSQVKGPYRFRRASFYAFLFGRDLPGRSAAPVFKNTNFEKLGVCTLRNGDDIMVTLDHGPFLGHGHLDKLAFTLYANDTVLVPDYGTPGYGSGIVNWYQSTAAHNTVVVDGKSQQPSKTYGLGSLYSGSFAQFADCTADDCYPGVVHRRRILLLGSACVISDRLTSDTEHDYDWFVRCEGQPTLVGEYDSAEIAAQAYPQIDVKQAVKCPNALKLDWKCENGLLSFAIWPAEQSAAVALGECPAETGARSVSTLFCRQHARSASFLAAMAAFGPEEKPDIGRDGACVVIGTSESKDYITMSEAGLGNDGGPITTDAEVAAVRTRGGEVTAIALIRGTYVKWRGETLLECPAPAECVEIVFQERGPIIRYCSDTAGTVRLKTKARAMRVNGHRAAANNSNGHALLRVTPQMLVAETIHSRP